jgi:hypothetical protein
VGAVRAIRADAGCRRASSAFLPPCPRSSSHLCGRFFGTCDTVAASVPRPTWNPDPALPWHDQRMRRAASAAALAPPTAPRWDGCRPARTASQYVKVVVFNATRTEMTARGHEPRLIAPQYVRPFVKRQTNDTADAPAIVIAARQPEMRCVAPKPAEQPSRAAVLRGRDGMVHQRTACMNVLRAVLHEHDHVFSRWDPNGPRGMRRREPQMRRSRLMATSRSRR